MTFSQFEAKEINNPQRTKKPDYRKIGYNVFMHNYNLPFDKDYWWKAETFQSYGINCDSRAHMMFEKGFSQAANEIREKLKLN